MKKIVFTCMLSLLALLVSCGGNSSGAASTSQSVKTDTRGFPITEFADVITGHTTSFAQMPSTYGKKSEKKGAVVDDYYTTDAYKTGITYNKHATVYLPYGYNKDDKTKKYNVIYFHHGNKRSENDLMSSKDPETATKMLIDNMFDADKGGIDPCIIFFMTYYPDDQKNTAGDLGTEAPGGEANYYLELKEDAIPTLEPHYNTYLEGTASDDIVASRSHRAISGYSHGSACTWYLLEHDFEAAQWWMPFSAAPTLDMNTSTTVTDEKAWERFEPVFAANKNSSSPKSFFIYGLGGKKEAEGVGKWFDYLVSQHSDYFSFGTDSKANNICYAASNFIHLDEYSPYYWYNALQTVFH